MGNGKIFYNNVISTATITVTPEPESSEGFGKEYLTNHNQGVVWRSPDISERSILISFGESVTVKGVVTLNHNLESGDTFAFEASTDNFATVAQSVTIDPAEGYIEVDWYYQYYRLRLQKSGGDYIQVGEIYLMGAAYEFDRNYNWGYSCFGEINRTSRQTTSGQIYRKVRFIRRGFNLNFEALSDSQQQVFEDIFESDYICFLPSGGDGPLYYGIVDFSGFEHAFDNYWNTSFTFTENPA